MTGEEHEEQPIETWPAGHELYRNLRERLAALMEEQVVVGRCTSCPDFRAEGPLKEARATFRAHVELMHPERVAALNVKRLPMPTREPDYVILQRLSEIAGAAA